jgi:threonine dehydratase
VAYSSGNHAQGVALAGQMLGIKSVIFMPQDVATSKVEATRRFGGAVEFYDRATQDGAALAQAFAETHGSTLIPPADHLDIIAGQGSVTAELFADAGPLDVLIAPIGAGGLLAGGALVAKALNPTCRIIGVEPEAANDAQQSFRQGALVSMLGGYTIADGGRAKVVGTHNFAILKALLDDIVTVSDADLIDVMKFFATDLKMVVEPTACLATAAVFAGKVEVRGQRVGLIVTGGNVDLPHYLALLQT